MPDIYSYPTENQTLGFNEIVSWVNDVTDQTFFPLVLLAMFIITFVSTMYFGTGRAFVYSSFFCSVLAIFMAVARMINPMYMYFSFVLLGIGMIIMRLSKSSTAPQI